MATKKKNLETLRSDFEASKTAYEEAENERIAEFTKLLFSDEKLRKTVLNLKTSELKATAKDYAERIMMIEDLNSLAVKS